MRTEAESHQSDTMPERILLKSMNPGKNARKEKAHFILLIIGLQTSLFLSALDTTILATSLPTIGSEFQAMSISSWIATSYIVTGVVFQPLFAKFSDITGRKPVMLFCLGVFLLGSILCSISKTVIMLITFRALQGIGAAGIGPMTSIIMSDIIPLEKLGNYQGITSSVYALASVIGPLIGGSFTDHLGWRWNFYINIPIGAGAIAFVYMFLHLPVEKQNFKDKLMRIDYAGSFLILASTTIFLVAIGFGGQTHPWNSSAVIVPLIMSGILLITLIVVEVNFVAEPFLPPRLFKNRTVVGNLLVAFFYGMCYITIIYYLPIYLQGVRGDSAMWSGIHVLPMEASSKVFSIGLGFLITKLGLYRIFAIGAMTVLTLSVGLFSLLSVETSWSMFYGFITIAGTGIGAYFATSIVAIRAAVERRDIATVIGLQRFILGVGIALGIAVASTAFNSALRKDLSNLIPDQYAEQVFQSPKFIRTGLPPSYFDVTINAYVSSVKLVWHIAAIMAGLGFLSSLLIKEYSLRPPQPTLQTQPTRQTQNVSCQISRQEYIVDLTTEQPKSVISVDESNKM